MIRPLWPTCHMIFKSTSNPFFTTDNNVFLFPLLWGSLKQVLMICHPFLSKYSDSSGEFVRTKYCSSCGPLSFCPKPLMCPEGVSCPAKVGHWRFQNYTEGVDFAPNWCVARLDPEGTLSSMPTVLTTFIGEREPGAHLYSAK